MKMAFISNHPAPYRDSFIGELVDKLGDEIEVFSEMPFDPGHSFWDLEKVRYETEILVRPGMGKAAALLMFLRRFVFGKFDFVVWPGLMKVYTVIPILLSAVLGKKYAFAADTVKQRKTSWLAYRIKRFIARRASLILVPGKAGADFWRNEFGVAESRILFGAYALDGITIEKLILEKRITSSLETSSTRDKVRADLGLDPNDEMFLMVANMIKTRHYPITSAAFIRFAKNHPQAKFVMVGRGPDVEAISMLTKNNPCLRIIPGCSFAEMIDLYAAADVYVHGGIEPASTALVIGALAHLPIVSSLAVGCSADCLRDGVTGCVVQDYLDENMWLDGFNRIVMQKDRWTNMGRAGRSLVRVLDVDVCAKNFIDKIREIFKRI